MSNSEKQQKQIHLDYEVVKELTHQAIEAGTNFKNYVEFILTEQAGITPVNK